MAGRNRITIEQSQRLSLNTQLGASIKLLEMDAVGLCRYLDEVAAQNPALVVGPRPVGEWLPRWTEAFSRGGGSFDADQIADTAGPSLIAHVEAAVAGLRLGPSEARLARLCIEALEPSGWLGRPLAALAAEAGVPVDLAGAVLARLQGLEPTGIFARSLSECLCLQAAEEGWLDPVARGVLERLPLVAEGATGRIASAIGCGEDAVRAVIRRIRTLDPKPGARFSHGAAPLREPDLIARKAGVAWEVLLNRSALPTLQLGDAKGKGRAEARALIRLVEGRNATLLMVAGEILSRQATALDEGAGALQPLTMAEVANALGLNQSTVSRVVAGAAVDTPRGTWWLRAMFSQAIRGQGPSAASLREALSRMVAAEDPAAPLTDADLAAALAGAGAPVARRTVAKYREMLAIPPAASAAQARHCRSQPGVTRGLRRDRWGGANENG